MGVSQTRADAESRLRRAFASLRAARTLLQLEEPCIDDAVSRATAAALHAMRALVDSQWARDSQPGWDPTFRPGMARPGRSTQATSHEGLQRLLERYDRLASKLDLPQDFSQYLRTLVEDGLDADTGEAPGYDVEEAEIAVETSLRLIATVAQQLGMAGEFAARFGHFAVTEPILPIVHLHPAKRAAEAKGVSPEGGNS